MTTSQRPSHLLYRSRFLLLFISLILLIIVSPYLRFLPYGNWLMNAVSYLILFTAVYAMVHHPIKYTIGIILGIIAFVFSTINISNPTVNTEIVRIIATLCFYSYISVAIFFTILKGRRITSDTIFASLCAYLFIGLTYAEIYHLTDLIHPNSFAINSAMQTLVTDTGYQYFYFSFTTLTTVGFGDIVAVSPYALSFVILEEITGIFYMAVVVARLVAGLRFGHDG